MLNKIKIFVFLLNPMLFSFGYSQTVMDIDSNIYSTVNISGQVWMAENLKTTHYANGDPIPMIPIANQWFNLSSGAYCFFQNDTINAQVYGNLYNGYVVQDGRGICPVNWHVPTELEWSTLLSNLGGDSIAGGKMKEIGTTHWASPNLNATNTSGFTALPNGFRGTSSPLGYGSLTITASFWTFSTSAYFLNFNTFDIEFGGGNLKTGLAIRCIENNTQVGIEEIPGSIRILISPNPAISTINIQSNTRIILISIIDINGRVVLNQKVNLKTILNLNISQLQSGIYYIQVRDANGSSRLTKIIKQ